MFKGKEKVKWISDTLRFHLHSGRTVLSLQAECEDLHKREAVGLCLGKAQGTGTVESSWKYSDCQHDLKKSLE